VSRFAPLEQVALAGQALARTLALLARPATWAPWIVLGAVQLALVVALWHFAHPWLSWALAPFIAGAGGEPLLHYPEVFRVLPALFGRANLVVGALLGPVVIGAATLLFARAFRGEPARAGAALAAAARLAPALVLVQLPFHLLVLGAGAVLGGVAGGGRGLPALIATAGLAAASVVLQSLFLYAAALVALERRGALAALAALPRTWARGFWAALVLGAAGVAALLPFRLLEEQTGLLVERGTPELAVALVVAQIAAGLLVWYALAGSATLVYLGAMAPEDEA